MKIMIDLHEEVYKYIMSLPYHTMLEECVKEGIPIIGGKAFKEYLKEAPEYCIRTDYKSGQVTIEVPLDWWEGSYKEEKE